MVIHTLSVNPEIDPDIAAMIGASAALAISGIPFNGPIGAARVGYIDGQYAINPTASQLKSSKLDLVVAGTENAVLMVESEADQLSEKSCSAAWSTATSRCRPSSTPSMTWSRTPASPSGTGRLRPGRALIAAVTAAAQPGLNAAYQVREKQARTTQLREVYANVSATLNAAAAEKGEPAPDAVTVDNILFSLESAIVRGQILNGEPRIDGRDTRTVRPISVRLGVLPRAHGSALFTRGETQALVVATLGTKQDEQIIDALMGEYRDRFMMHYNMPPFATGETGRIGVPKPRNRPRPPGQARADPAAAGPGRLPVHHPPRLGNHRVQRLLVDGFGLRRFAGHDGRRRAGQGPRRRRGDGPDPGRRQVRRADRHPGR